MNCAVIRHIAPVSGLTLAPWRLNQVAGRSSGQDPHATLDVLELLLRFCRRSAVEIGCNNDEIIADGFRAASDP